MLVRARLRSRQVSWCVLVTPRLWSRKVSLWEAADTYCPTVKQ